MKTSYTYKRINKVSSDYKWIIDQNHSNMKHLLNSLEFNCKWHKAYVKNNIQRFYDQYKPGTLLFVDFGVNVGSEFSKPHFAIVLDKNDNKINGNITVIPLTSKNSKYVLPINDSIFNTTIQHLKDALDKSDQEVEKYRLELKEVEKSIFETATELKVNTNNKETVELCLELSEIVKQRNEQDLREVVLSHIEELLKSVGRLQAKITEQKNCKNMIKDVLEQYSKFNKKSYVVYGEIRSISKLRVKKINRFDPSGKIRISQPSFEIIKNKIINHIF